MVKNKLCHSFRTDVVKIMFATAQADKQDVMLSVMYALLEALSAVLDIERNDIKGCLHKVIYEGKLVYSIVLYDAVAGGAGHVRRLVTEDGDCFRRVVEKAIEITRGCNCDPSCYSCLRNYYNQKIHEKLSRKAAYEFLENYAGEAKPISEEEFERSEPEDGMAEVYNSEALTADNSMPMGQDFDKAYVFVSYCHMNAQVVKEKIHLMKEAGYRVWYDANIRAGAEWGLELAARMNQASCYILFISNEYMRSENCKNEMNYIQNLLADRRSVSCILVWTDQLENQEDKDVLRLNFGRYQRIERWQVESNTEFMKELSEALILEECRERR